MNITLIDKAGGKPKTIELCCENEVSIVQTPIIVINKNSSDSSFNWITISTDISMTSNTGYLVNNNITRVDLSYSGIPKLGDVIDIFNLGIAGIRLLISDVVFGDKITTVNGYLESTEYGDYLSLKYLLGGWKIVNSIGNFQII